MQKCLTGKIYSNGVCHWQIKKAMLGLSKLFQNLSLLMFKKEICCNTSDGKLTLIKTQVHVERNNLSSCKHITISFRERPRITFAKYPLGLVILLNE